MIPTHRRPFEFPYAVHLVSVIKSFGNKFSFFAFLGKPGFGENISDNVSERNHPINVLQNQPFAGILLEIVKT